MMVQTGSLSPDAARWEISPVFAPSNTAMQTVRRPRKGKEKALKPSGFKAFPVAGAEGLEPSARGFGDYNYNCEIPSVSVHRDIF